MKLKLAVSALLVAASVAAATNANAAGLFRFNVGANAQYVVPQWQQFKYGKDAGALENYQPNKYGFGLEFDAHYLTYNTTKGRLWSGVLATWGTTRNTTEELERRPAGDGQVDPTDHNKPLIGEYAPNTALTSLQHADWNYVTLGPSVVWQFNEVGAGVKPFVQVSAGLSHFTEHYQFSPKLCVVKHPVVDNNANANGNSGTANDHYEWTNQGSLKFKNLNVDQKDQYKATVEAAQAARPDNFVDASEDSTSSCGTQYPGLKADSLGFAGSVGVGVDVKDFLSVKVSYSYNRNHTAYSHPTDDNLERAVSRLNQSHRVALTVSYQF